jgi:hypothetical protein
MKSNNWEIWHDNNWTEFETHSAIFGILRKELKGKYLVRGEYCFLTKDGKQYRPDISIFQVIQKGKPATLRLIIEVKKEGSQINPEVQLKKYSELGVPIILVTGKEGLGNIQNIIEEHL